MGDWFPVADYPTTRNEHGEGPKVLVWQLPDGLKLSGVTSNPTIGFIRGNGWLSIETEYDPVGLIEANLPCVPWRWMPLPEGPP